MKPYLYAMPLALLLASCASTQPIEPTLAPATVDFANAERIEVQLDSFDFSPRDIVLPANRPVMLVLTNVSDGGHNFAASDFFAAAQIRVEDAPLVESGAVEVAAGETVSIFLVPASGDYQLDCTHLGHKAFGMTGSIAVR